MDVLKSSVCASGLVYLKEKGKEAYTSSAALTVPGHVSNHRLRTEGGKHTSKCVLDYCGVILYHNPADTKTAVLMESQNTFLQLSKNIANNDATVGMQCCVQLCR